MYLLDTNAVSEPLKQSPNRGFMSVLDAQKPEHLFSTSITVMELRHGAMLIKHRPGFWENVTEKILSRYPILDFGEPEALIAGDLLAELTRRGEFIGFEDTMIASIALSHGFTVVTRNEKHFQRIPGLKIENWMK